MLEKLIPVQYRALVLAGLIIVGLGTVYGLGHRRGTVVTSAKYETKIAKMIKDNADAVAKAKDEAIAADRAQAKIVVSQLDWQASTARMHAAAFNTLRTEIRALPAEPLGLDAPAHSVVLKAVRGRK